MTGNITFYFEKYYLPLPADDTSTYSFLNTYKAGADCTICIGRLLPRRHMQMNQLFIVFSVFCPSTDSVAELFVVRSGWKIQKFITFKDKKEHNQQQKLLRGVQNMMHTVFKKRNIWPFSLSVPLPQNVQMCVVSIPHYQILVST